MVIMSNELKTELAKIESIKFGYGGYQDVQLQRDIRIRMGQEI